MGSGSQVATASPVPARGAKSQTQKKPTGKTLQVANDGESLGEASLAGREAFEVISNQLNAGNTQFSGQQEEGELGLQGGCDVAPSEQPWDAGELLDT